MNDMTRKQLMYGSLATIAVAACGYFALTAGRSDTGSDGTVVAGAKVAREPVKVAPDNKRIRPKPGDPNAPTIQRPRISVGGPPPMSKRPPRRVGEAKKIKPAPVA